MKEAQFVRQNRADWLKLESLASALEQRGRRLGGNELLTLISLYRKAVGDLARARMLQINAETVSYLNQLVGRVHFLIYAPPPYPFHKVVDFFHEGFPRAVRRQWKYLLASVLLLLIPAGAAYWAVEVEPALGSAFAPPGYVDQVEEAFGEKFGKKEGSGGMHAVATSFYIVNNVQVSFLAFATGALFGLGSAFVIVQNGMILGGVAAVIRQHGLSANFWAFVSSHGGVELGAIVLAGAAGLKIGVALLNPGLLTRRDALAAAGREAGLLMFGVIAMLCLAACLEAWVSPSMLPNPFKYALGAINLLAVLAYFALAGRPRATPAQK